MPRAARDSAAASTCVRVPYYFEQASGVVTWTRPTGANIDIVASSAVATETPRATHWLQHIGTDGLPDLANPTLRPADPLTPWWLRIIERTHYALVYSRTVSLSVAGAVVIVLAVWSWREHSSEAQHQAAIAARKASTAATRTGDAQRDR